MHKKETEIKSIFGVITILFLVFLFVPMALLLVKSLQTGKTGEIGFHHYIAVLSGKGFLSSVLNSFRISAVSAGLSVLFAFVLAYTINQTNVNQKIKKIMKMAAVLPMLLPTITYGFAIIYSFGKQGLITKFLGFQPFEIYGWNGLLIGYVIYTLPIAFLLIHNTFQFIDKKFIIVSRVMGDRPIQTFYITALRPMFGTLGAAFIQAFFLSFTDFGIPAAVGGEYNVAATALYNEMLGAVPDFNRGAVVAVVMLIPSVISILVLTYLEKFNFRYHKVTQIEWNRNPFRDISFGIMSGGILVFVLSIFAVIFVIPFVKEWPYEMAFTLDKMKEAFSSASLMKVYQNSIFVAGLTALFGTLAAYSAALVTARSHINKTCKSVLDSIALVINTIPGMILGISFLFVFSGTSLQNTFFILIVCNIIHFFSTPYLMMKNSLSKMNHSWETTAMLMGDSWLKTVIRVVTPNAGSTILEVFSYYFTNAMVTISAVIFITGARTMVITTKIKELQHYAKFDEIFILSLFLLFTNLIAKVIFQCLADRNKILKEILSMKKRWKPIVSIITLFILTVGIVGCSQASAKGKEVIFYSNADEEAMQAMQQALNQNGYEGQYILQSFGTSELGGKLLAEGKNLEADLITMSSFYIDSAQEENQMFLDLTFPHKTLAPYPAYETPVTAQEGAMIVNTKVMQEQSLTLPTSLKDLAKPEYEGAISVTDIMGSSTGWLLVQAIRSEYGEAEGKEIMTGILKNAGPHLESSGSGPIKKVRAGEVAIAFGLRHQAVADKEKGLPIDYIDPIEGNFSLTESIAVLDKGDKTNPLAMEMAQCIIENGRSQIQKTYPLPLYEGEEIEANKSAYPKIFEETLTVDLLKKHQEFSESCK